MKTQVWSKVEEKWADLLTLQDNEVHRLKVTGNMLTLKRNLGKVLEALEQGKAPADCGAKVIETIDPRTITKAELGEGNGSLTIHGGGTTAKSLKFSTGEGNADQILGLILAQSGRAFQPKQEEISVVEALIPPGVVGLVVGGLSFAAYDAASKMAQGEDVEVNGLRRRGMKRMLLSVAEMLGTTGITIVGGVLLLLIAAWAVRRITHRPMRTVLLPADAVLTNPV